jgi:hypothetical protein
MKNVLALALLVAGCSSSSAPVTLHFSASNATPSPGSGYAAPTGTVGTNQDMQLVLDSQAGGAELKIAVDMPQMPSTIPVSGGIHLTVEYSTSPGGPTFVSNSGSITFQTVTAPYNVTMDHLEMIGSAASGASGAFFIDGTGQYDK